MGSLGRCVLLAALGIGCGNVKNEPDPDAPQVVDGNPDMGSTCPGTEVDACGANCATCTASNDREVPTCNGTTCGTACVDSAPRCDDQSCSRITWTFQSSSVDGISGAQPVGLQVGVRNFNGALALAVDVPSLTTEHWLRIPVCLSGVVDASALTLSMKVYFQGGTASTQEQYYVAPAVPTPQTNAYLTSDGMRPQLWETYSAPMSGSMFSNTTSEITVRFGSFGGAFAGTVWFDDIKLE
jgi:hypothetical protein